MVGVTAMEGDPPSEGLFLKTYLGTVSAVPRPRTAAHMETKPSHVYGEHKIGHPMENGMLNHARIIYESGPNDGKQHRSEIVHGNHLEDVIQAENDDDREKKKEKKWSLGGFFRRKSKKDADDSSEESGEDKKGFLHRRKSKRSGRKPKTNGFDVVIPQHKDAPKNGEISVEQLWRGDPKPPEPGNGPVRYIHRHPDAKNNSLQVSKHSRRDSNLSRSSGENAENRKGRKEVMARAEAKRDMIRDDSSSDEYESYHSNSSLNRINGERRPRRADKLKRLSKDEEADLRIIKSDFESGRRPPPNYRWIPRTYYPDSSDHEAAKLNLMNHSGTPSPCRSPRSRQKQLLHYMMMQNAHPTSTFPPGIHQQARNGTPCLSPTRAKENLPFGCRNQGYRINRNSEYNLSRSISSENSNRKTLMDYEQFLNSCGSAKSLSYDQNIHRAACFETVPELGRSLNARRAVCTSSGRPADIYNPRQAAKTYNGVVENRSDSTASLQSGIFPQQPTQIVQRSASGVSFVETSRNPHRSSSYQHIPTTGHHPKDAMYCNLPPSVDSMAANGHLNGAPSILRYYADQNPRSRNPIHITCNPTTPEQPYLSDSQMMVKPVQNVRNSASDFWKLKDQEMMKQKQQNSLKPPQNSRSDRSRSNSPRGKEPVRTGQNLESSKVSKEECNVKVNQTPPEPPVRRLSKQEVLARLQKCEQLKNQENELRSNMRKVQSSNLDDALNELEMIYNSLRLKDDDLADRAERRDLPVYRPKHPITPVSVRDKIQNFYAEADYPKPAECAPPNGHQRAIPLRRSGVPDKTTDDMAFRRMNQKDRTDAKKLPQQSYLRSSPALSPIPNGSPTFRKESPVLEPDVTFDDVVFRNIRHANSTLKIQDPQPPFGIPVGVIAPAPNSDYLHATPTERFRPTFTSSRTPDVVKDDLAFRNLRKDNKTNVEPKNEMKKRAVRSLSANLYNIMQKDGPPFVPPETNNNVIFEKTQSLTDLSKGKQTVEKRLKELKEEKNARRAEFFELSRKNGAGDASWTDLAGLDLENLESKSQKDGQSEELTKKFRSPVVELSKYPAAAPTSTLQGNPFKEPSFDDDQLENLLSALAKEAENASKDLERQLDRLETKKTKAQAIEEFNRKFKSPDKAKRRRNLSLSNASETKEEVRKTGSLERRKKNPFEEAFRSTTTETKSKPTERDRRRSQSFEMVTDLSQILVEVQQQISNEIAQKETNSVFQEVYEYNCKLPSPERRRSRSGEEPRVVPEAPASPEPPSDVETEFEKLHEEVNGATGRPTVDDLIADITSVERSPADSYAAFPFPNDGGGPSGSGASPGPGKGEGLGHA